MSMSDSWSAECRHKFLVERREGGVSVPVWETLWTTDLQ